MVSFYINILLQLKSPLAFFQKIKIIKNQKITSQLSIILDSEFFFVTIDKRLHELNSKFNDQVMNLLTLSSILIPKYTYKTFDIIRCVF